MSAPVICLDERRPKYISVTVDGRDIEVPVGHEFQEQFARDVSVDGSSRRAGREETPTILPAYDELQAGLGHVQQTALSSMLSDLATWHLEGYVAPLVYTPQAAYLVVDRDVWSRTFERVFERTGSDRFDEQLRSAIVWSHTLEVREVAEIFGMDLADDAQWPTLTGQQASELVGMVVPPTEPVFAAVHRLDLPVSPLSAQGTVDHLAADLNTDPFDAAAWYLRAMVLAQFDEAPQALDPIDLVAQSLRVERSVVSGSIAAVRRGPGLAILPVDSIDEAVARYGVSDAVAAGLVSSARQPPA